VWDASLDSPTCVARAAAQCGLVTLAVCLSRWHHHLARVLSGWMRGCLTLSATQRQRLCWLRRSKVALPAAAAAMQLICTLSLA
jgi:hypothetical protein